MVRIAFHSNVEKSIKKLPYNVRVRFFKAIELLRQQPLAGIPLKGEFKGERKYRFGEYRLLYKYFSKEKTILIYRVESRQGAYKH